MEIELSEKVEYTVRSQEVENPNRRDIAAVGQRVPVQHRPEVEPVKVADHVFSLGIHPVERYVRHNRARREVAGMQSVGEHERFEGASG